jgi:DNA-binding response OmpR family regulator
MPLRLCIDTPFQDFKVQLLCVQWDRLGVEQTKDLQEAHILLCCYPPAQAIDFIQRHIGVFLNTSPVIGFLILEPVDFWDKRLEESFGPDVLRCVNFLRLSLSGGRIDGFTDFIERLRYRGGYLQRDVADGWKKVGRTYAQRVWETLEHLISHRLNDLSIEEVEGQIRVLYDLRGCLDQGTCRKISTIEDSIKEVRSGSMREDAFRRALGGVIRPPSRSRRVRPQAVTPELSGKFGILEDDERDRQEVYELLGNPDIQINLFPEYERRGLEELVRNHAYHLRLLIVDLHLGRGPRDGIEVIRAFHSKNPYLPILVLTRYENLQVMEEARRAGATWFIPKSRMKEELTFYARWYSAERRVVIVDDKPKSLRPLTSAIEARGWSWMLCRSPQEFQKSVRDHLKTWWVDLVVLDVLFGGAPQGLRLLNQIPEDMPVALITAAQDIDIWREATFGDRRVRIFLKSLYGLDIDEICRMVRPRADLNRIRLVEDGPKVVFGEVEVRLQPAQWAFVYLLAWMKEQGKPGIETGIKSLARLPAQFGSVLARAYRRVQPAKRPPQGGIEPLRSYVNRAVREALRMEGWELIVCDRGYYCIHPAVKDVELPEDS